VDGGLPRRRDEVRALCDDPVPSAGLYCENDAPLRLMLIISAVPVGLRQRRHRPGRSFLRRNPVRGQGSGCEDRGDGGGGAM